MATFSERIAATREGERVWHQERAIFETTERLCALMDQQGVSRKDLAERLGKSKGYITQLLDGQTNMTIRTISDTFLALGRAVHIEDGPVTLELDEGPQTLCIYAEPPEWSEFNGEWSIVETQQA